MSKNNNLHKDEHKMKNLDRESYKLTNVNDVDADLFELLMLMLEIELRINF